MDKLVFDKTGAEETGAEETGFDSAAPGHAGKKTSAGRAPVLVAVDLSEDSREAVLWASDYARRTSAPLHILHCLHDPADAPGTYSRAKADPLEPMADTAQRLLNDFVAAVRAARPDLESLAAASMRLVTGLPTQAIIDEAEALGAELIVLGSRGQNGLKRRLFGSVAQGVAQLSTIPVTVVKARR